MNPISFASAVRPRGALTVARCRQPSTTLLQCNALRSRAYASSSRPTARPPPSATTTPPPPPPPPPRAAKSPLYRRPGVYVLAAIPFVSIPFLLKEDEDDEGGDRPTLGLLSNRDLVRSYVVYTLCSFPTLIDVSPRLIDWAWNSYIPGLRFLAEKVIQYTFFEQFVGAETLEASRAVIEKLAKDNIGTLFNYSVEASEASAPKNAKATTGAAAAESPLHDGLVTEIVRSVDYAAEMNNREGLGTAVALKLSGLLKDPKVLLRVSSAIVEKEHFTDAGHHAIVRIDLWDYLSKTMTATDAHAVRELLRVLEKIGERARPANVKLIIDAEQSWLQPAIDAFFLQVARTSNRVEGGGQKTGGIAGLIGGGSSSEPTVSAGESQPPVFYTTLQCSLRRSADLLEAFLEDGRKHGWAVGVKVVRGAYVDQEHKASELAKTLTPAWSSKAETDKCFNTCAKMLLDDIAHDLSTGRPGAAGAMFASHNRESVTLLLKILRSSGLAKAVDGRKAVASDAVVTPEGSEAADVAALPSDEVPTLMMDYAAARRICFGQLYGMADDITSRLSNHLLTPSHAAPAVYKYLPYGPLDRVLPYLVRRAKENKAIMTSDAGGGGALAEKRRLKAEMRKRVKAWWAGSA